jgi:hypothetical protein
MPVIAISASVQSEASLPELFWARNILNGQRSVQ